MEKNFKDNYHESHKPTLKVNTIAKLRKENPNLRYHAVRIDNIFDPNQERVEKAMDKGWSVVTTEQALIQDDTSEKSSSKVSGYKSTPLTRKGKGGAEFVWMSIPKEKFQENHQERVEKDLQRFEAASTGRKVIKKPGSIKIIDAEIGEDDVKDLPNN